MTRHVSEDKRGVTAIELVMVIAIIAILAAAFVPAYLDHEAHKDDRCVEWHKYTTTTYPNMGLQAFGPQYIGIALMPVESEVAECLKWVKK